MTPECWQWAAGLTEIWEIDESKDNNQGLRLRSKLTGNKYSITGLNGVYREQLESLIYQAIDGINETDNIHFDSMAHGARIEMIINDELFKNYFHYSKYPSKTQARLAALEWIFEQTKKSNLPYEQQFTPPLDPKRKADKHLIDAHKRREEDILPEPPIVKTIKVKIGTIKPMEPPDFSDIINRLEGE